VAGRVSIEEREAPDAEAHVGGDEAAWIEAFRPGGSTDRLEITGDSALAHALLDGMLTLAARASTAAA
jgi:hypothetical protein